MVDIRDIANLPDEARIAAVMRDLRLGRVQAIHHLRGRDAVAAKLRHNGGRW